MNADLFTTTVDAAAAHAAQHAEPLDDGPTLADARDDMPPLGQRRDPLGDKWLCWDPWCPAAVAQPRHLHGTRPDGRRV